MIIGTALFVGATILVGCGGGEATTDANPGFSGEDRTVDTSPFEMPALNDSPTTLPDSFFESTTTEATLPLPPPTTTAPPTTSTSTSTSTTTTLPTPIVPELANITDLCGFASYMSSFYGLSKESPRTVQRKVTALVAVLRRLAEVAPASVRADVVAIATALSDLRDVLRTVDWNPDAPEYKAALQGYIDGTGGKPKLNDAINRVTLEEAREC